MSKVNGSSKTSSSRFAEMYQMLTLSPALIACPRISVSLVTLRRKYMTGDAQRTISSVASCARRRVVDEQLVLLGVVAERADAVRDRVARRLVAGDGEQQEEEVEVHLRERVAVDLGLEQRGDDVVARVRRAVRPRARSRT